LDKLNGLTPQDVLDAACAIGEQKATDLTAIGPDQHGLSADEIAAINVFTQEDSSDRLYSSLNAALRSAEPGRVRPFWSYIRLLQQALAKLPESEAGAVFRGIQDRGMQRSGAHHYELETLQQMVRDGTPEIWWGFSSTSTSLEAVNTFLGGADAKKVIFTIDGGSSARDVKRYSAEPQEDELMLPCGTSFEVKTAASPTPNLLLVKVKETQATLFGAGRVAQPPALTELAQLLDAEGAAVDSASRQLEFHQQLPTGLMGLLINRCAARLCRGNPTSIWRRDLLTIVPAPRSEAMVLDEATAARLGAMKTHALRSEAQAQGVSEAALLDAESRHDESTTMKQAKQDYLALIASAPIKIELAISQQGSSTVALHARCLRDGGSSYHEACVRQLLAFEAEIEAVMRDSWPGCSASATGDALEEVGPEPEPELGGEPEPETEGWAEEGVPPQ